MKSKRTMNSINLFKFCVVLGTAFFLSKAIAKDQLDGVMPMNSVDMNDLDKVMHANKPLMVVYPNESDKDVNSFNYALYPLDEKQFQTAQSRIGMQIGLGGNPDVDNGKLFRNQAWNISILYPVKQTEFLPTAV